MTSLTGLLTVIILAGVCTGRELRPSDHGLGYQSSPPANSPPDMKSFFNSNNSSSSSSFSDASPWNLTNSLPPVLPRTTGHDGGRLGKALVMASLVCGITGVILLVVSVLLFLFKRRRRNSEQNDSFRVDDDNFNFNNNNNNDNANKLEVVRSS
ncbi:uncharacterized protein LOC131622415 [Vicia villosa]|uniref:uncharacterized protein LOC131622415 n=1 Tax=Vicia villosa TaxID=3911 RepID=UPI00273CB88E|nr:uncharacterized protein LOC131622415 [Vicia villosa]